MMLPEENPHITVVGPDNGSVVPVFKIDSNNSGLDTFLTPDGSPDLDGSSSGGYSSPNTPLNLSLDLNLFESFAREFPDFDHTLGVMANSMGPYSPSTLSPCFNGLTLGDNVGNEGNPFDALADQHEYQPSDYLLLEQEVRSSSPSRSPLAPLVIPGSPQPHLQSTDELWNPQQPAFVDGDRLFNQMLQIDDAGQSPYLSQASPNRNNQTGYHLPDNALSLEPSLQRLPRSQGMHNRHKSEINTPWTGSSHSSTSPSLTLTPSEQSSSAGSLLPEPYQSYNDQLTLSDAATVTRRHSHSGARGSRGVGPDRGRSEVRSPPSSANSSRRSSPYPTVLLSASPVSPHQVYEADNHLAVPFAEAFEGVRRRHSFTYGGRPHEPAANPAMLMMGFQQDSPSTPTTSRSAGVIASKAGILASAARRTKEAKFGCHLCTQTFTTNHNLKNHLNVHFNIKDHACSDCNRTFTTQSVLARHSKTCKANPQNAHRRRLSDASG